MKVKSKISNRLIGHTGLNNFKEKVEELKKAGEVISPDGEVYVTLIDRSEVYLPITKAIRDLMDLDFIYSMRALQAKPELAEEYSEIMKHVKEIDKIVTKQRRKRTELRKKRETKKNDGKN